MLQCAGESLVKAFQNPCENWNKDGVGNILGLAILAATELSEPIQLLHETMAIISEQQKFREHFEAERNVWMAQKTPKPNRSPK